MELQSLLDRFEATGAAIWAISSDDPERLRSFRDKEGIGFSLLLDGSGESFVSFGIRNERDDRTIPHPTVIVIDRNGVARYVVSDDNYRVRPSSAEVLAAVEALVTE